MDSFLQEYGIWLLIAVVVLVLAVILLTRRGKGTDAAEQPAPLTKTAAAPVIVPEPVAPIAAPQPDPTTPDVADAQEPVPAPQPLPPAAPRAPASAGDDNLLQLKGVGPKVNGLLIDLGITRFDQIAAWTDADIARVDAQLGSFKGRIARDQWVDQAGYLARGDIAGFEAKYGKL